MNCIVKLLLTAFVLLGAAFHFSYGYYEFLRWAVTIVCCYYAVVCLIKKEPIGIVYIGIAVLFNPIWKIILSAVGWKIVDFVLAIFLFFQALLSEDCKFNEG
jgi:hypothetical protein